MERQFLSIYRKLFGSILERTPLLKLLYFKILLMAFRLLNLSNLIKTRLISGLLGISEPPVFAIFNRLPKGSVVIDVGAYIGYYSLLSIAKKASEVIAIEPNPKNYERLLNHIKRFPNSIAVNAAVSDESGVAKLYLGPTEVTHSIINKSGVAIEVACIALDELIRKFGVKKVDLIKIDVEGAELKVLKGAEKSLGIAKQVVIDMHFSPNSVEYQEIIALLNRKGFTIKQLEDPLTKEIRYFYCIPMKDRKPTKPT